MLSENPLLVGSFLFLAIVPPIELVLESGFTWDGPEISRDPVSVVDSRESMY
jgi:hypothetical protein